MEQKKTISKKKSEPILVSGEVISYIRETLAEMKSDIKDIKKTQVEHDKELDRLKWRYLVVGVLGGMIPSIGIKFRELFP